MAVYGLVKRESVAPSSKGGIPKRIKEIRRAMGPWPGKLLPRQQLGQRVGVDASTVKKWETGEVTISTDNALKLAEVAGCNVEWILTGRGRPPKQATSEPGGGREGQPPTPPARLREQPSSYSGGERRGAASSEALSAEQIADEVGAVLEPLVLLLAAKGESVVARWLLAVAGEANDQSVDNVRPIIDLAREFLWRAERIS